MVVWSPLALGVIDAIVANWNFWGKRRMTVVRSGSIWAQARQLLVVSLKDAFKWS
jgi:hypothetical protein